MVMSAWLPPLVTICFSSQPLVCLVIALPSPFLSSFNIALPPTTSGCCLLASRSLPSHSYNKPELECTGNGEGRCRDFHMQKKASLMIKDDEKMKE
eukprot:c30339_g1_i1 orf=868-1155(+)